MPAPDFTCVMTTIQEPTGCVLGLSSALSRFNGDMLVMGDRKGPAKFELPGARFYSLAEQQTLPLKLAPLLPVGHYVRKNLGYLLAFRSGVQRIYETDDDNQPLPDWKPLPLETRAASVSAPKWLNVYRLFTQDLIWPRGLPLDRVTDSRTFGNESRGEMQAVTAPIQQGLANGSPDVDAVWRLILDRDFQFNPGPSVVLPPGTWCPFNSQNTWWWPAAYGLMYLPSYCTFRMTDIWRSFVAQRCLWELGHGVVFHAADVFQLRNVHNLMRDFKDEVPGYEQNDAIATCLAELSLRPGAGAVLDNLVRCYEALVESRFFPEGEMPLVRAWVEDCSSI